MKNRFILIELITIIAISSFNNLKADSILLNNIDFKAGLKGWMQRGKVSKLTTDEVEFNCDPKNRFTIIQQKVAGIKIGDIVEFSATMKSDNKGGQLVLCEGGSWGGKQKLSQYKKSYLNTKGKWQNVSVYMRVHKLPLYAGIGLYRTSKQKLFIKSVNIKKVTHPTQLTMREAANLWNTTFSPQSNIFDKQVFRDYNDINVFAAANEFALAAVMIYNPGEKNLYAKIKVLPVNEAAQQLGVDKIKIREALHVRVLLGQLVADPLPTISKDRVVSIPAGETRQILLEFFTGKTKSIKYQYKLQINNINNKQECASIPVNFNIMNFVLPENIPLNIATWDCNLRNRKGKLRAEILKILRSAKVNTFHVLAQMKAKFKKSGEMIGKPDFSELNELLKLYGTKNVQIWLRGGRFLRPGKKVSKKAKEFAFYTPEWRKALRAWVEAVRDHMAEMGYKKNQWCFYPYDEYLGESYQKVVYEIRTIDPSLKIFADPCKPKIDSAKSLLKMAKEKKFDILCPVFGKYYPRENYKNVPAQMKQLGIKQAFYYCPIVQKRLCPINFYREMGWRIYHYNLDGGGYWTAVGYGDGRWGGNPWNDFDAKTASPVSIYNYAQEVVPSRRWLAFRAGIEDYCYIHLLKQSMSRQEIDNLLGENKKLPKRNYIEIETLRRKMSNKILSLQGGEKIKFPISKTIAIKPRWSYLVARDKKEPARLELMLKNYLKTATLLSPKLPEGLRNTVRINAKKANKLLKSKNFNANAMPQDLEKIGVKYGKNLNPEIIQVQKNKQNTINIKLTLYNLSIPYSQWVAIQVGTLRHPGKLKLYILNGSKKHQVNEANVVQIPVNEPVDIEIKIDLKDLKGLSTELNIFPLNHLNKGSVRKIKINTKKESVL